MDVNADIVEGKWNEFRGAVKQRWGKFTDRELDQISGQAEEMIGMLQEKYGYSRERASDELEKLAQAYSEQMDEMRSAARRTTKKLQENPTMAFGLIASLVLVVAVIYLFAQRK